jgi:hypothetical protein
MAKKILNIATFGLAGALFGGKDKKKAAPAPEPAPRVMPLADDDAVMRARRRSIAEQQRRAGRSSTMLTAESDSLGGS